LKQAIQDFAYNYDNQEVLEGLQWVGLDPAKDEDWNTIRELQIGKDILEVQSDENLSPEDKEQQIAELNKQLEALK
jgi:phosphonate transport system substrate-binding protein